MTELLYDSDKSYDGRMWAYATFSLIFAAAWFLSAMISVKMLLLKTFAKRMIFSPKSLVLRGNTFGFSLRIDITTPKII